MRIVFTGGGSAGHVTPNLALIDKVQSLGWTCFYIGSRNGIEKTLIAQKEISYYAIQSGKLRRELTLKNMLTPFKVLIGIVQSFFLCRKIKPQLVFSKGGFVAFPVVFAAWLNRIPIVAHESDFSPGLANRMSYPFASLICLSFEETKRFFKNKAKLTVTGTPIRQELFKGSAERGRAFCGFNIKDKKILLIIGGGLGAIRINQQVRDVLPALLKTWFVIHICGQGKSDQKIQLEGYRQFEYIHEELADLFACASLVISRAGANTIYELFALKKPTLFIPLAKASRGDQIHNARYFEKKKLCHVLDETKMTNESFLKAIADLDADLPEIDKALQTFETKNGTDLILNALKKFL